MKFKFTYLLTYLLTLVVFTSCDSNDLFEESKSEEIELASRATSSFLVSVDEAKGIAMKKLPIRINPCDFVHLPLFTQLEADNVITIYDKNSIPAMYLFNKEGNDGFLLLSASKLEEPILAYSTESKLELSDMPRDLAVWIDLGVTKISQLNRKGFYYSMGVYDAWRSLGFDEPASDYVIANPDGGTIPIPTFTREDIGCPTYKINGPLLGDIMWGQGVGYNNEQDIATGCSNMPGGRYWAGCVMVAFGQIMKYHNDFGNLRLHI